MARIACLRTSRRATAKEPSKTQLKSADMIPEGESIKPDDEDIDSTEGDEIPAPEDKNEK
jgi:hypothetical protein